eukprot:UN01124
MSNQKPNAPKVAEAVDKDLFVDKSAALLEEEARKVKKTRDYTADIDAALPDILKAYEADPAGTLQTTIQQILPWEKKSRLASDVVNTIRLSKQILKLCLDNQKYDLLTEYLTFFVKSRAQMVGVIKTIVQYVLNVVLYGNEEGKAVTTASTTMGDDDQVATTTTTKQYNLTYDERLSLLNTIITVADSRLCVEYEHSTAVVYKANLLLNKNKTQDEIAQINNYYKYKSTTKEQLEEVYNLIIQIPAEVVGSMSYYEKCTTLLNQTKIALLLNNTTKALSLLKKIRLSELSKNPELKYYYHLLSSEVYYIKNDFLNTARHYQQLFLLTKPDEQTRITKPTVAAQPPAAPATKNAKDTKDTKPVVDDKAYLKAYNMQYRQSPADISADYAKTLLSTLYFTDIITTFYPTQQPAVDTWKLWLQRSIICAILAPYDYESEQLLNLFVLGKHEQYLRQTGIYYHLLNQFSAKQIIAWPITPETPYSQVLGDATNDNVDAQIFDILSQDDIFIFDQKTFPLTTTYGITTAADNTMSDDVPQQQQQDDFFNPKVNKYELLFKRVIHHNIRILSQNYSKIALDHAVDVICVEGLTSEYFEHELTSIGEQVKVKIDRRAKVIDFSAERSTGDSVLSKWADDLTELFKLVENTEQFIQKARVVEAAKKEQQVQ